MLDFFKRKDKDSQKKKDNEESSKSEKGLLTRLKVGLTRTRHQFMENFANLFLGKKEIDTEILEELEEILLASDLGMAATEQILKELTTKLKRHELKNVETLKDQLADILMSILHPVEIPLTVNTEKKPFVILMVGINGSGKTTTIGKLAKKFLHEGKTVLLAAGDTFRAAAIEQLKVWGERNEVPVIAQHHGSDSASVIFDALQSAIARNIDIVIADTAGRLHTKENLMEELKKIGRVLTKLDPSAPHEVMLVLDATLGQNALLQAQKFHEAIKVSGITLTKLDGTAKGGIIFNIAKTLKLPIRFIGVGEKIEDLRPFQAKPFVEALLMEES